MKQRKCLLAAVLALLLLVSGCAQKGSGPAAAPDPVPEAAPEVREITDMAGRTVAVPAEIGSVFSTGPVAAIYLYTLVPDKLLGWNYELNDIEKSVILEKYHALPNFGMGDAVNYEAVIAAGPSIALNVGTISDKLVSECDQLSQSLGIPVVAVDGDLTSVPEAYRFMGELFGAEEQADKLAAYAEKTFDDIAGMDIPEEEKVRVYYGNGEDSLETAPAGSSHGQILDMVNAVNVADLELGEGSRVQISNEQLLAWDPDVIVVIGEAKASMSGSAAAEAIYENPDFAVLKAVRNHAVYGVPNAPFSWVDRPPASNRIVGIRWLSGLLYPDRLNFDVDEEVREFFSLFYHVELTDEQLQALYNGAV
ncbi:MAG: ABC transporter substrate-binding protein [Oscillospiraceae bacterium]|nr:ABC transporter substrate-binding protein [Oscillospiraceae bacterium]